MDSMKGGSMAGSDEGRITWAPWVPGAEAATTQPVIVAVTDFHYDGVETMHQAARVGLGLSRSWGTLQGAVGLWLWNAPGLIRGGSISIWDTEGNLWRFINSPVHLRIMAAWRGRGVVTSDHWRQEDFDHIEVRESVKTMLLEKWRA
ncbi:hypothetical protein IU427_25555 [Nocardia beijingensis]|uniref:hypothetical protein n=1 Tax=Nocardia beijingensis TaxID=95162 RepID=UPI001893E6E4|nr:hypothetical protein [Nocardia beijingensis]MBF6468505.1 hypothetical protein [Nocardia beijingensis]